MSPADEPPARLRAFDWADWLPLVDVSEYHPDDWRDVRDRVPTGAGDERRYSPAVCTGIGIRPVTGNPDLDKASTSYVERQNLTMRMGMRRFTRLTNGFSKKVENLAHAVSLHYMHYNFARPHKTLTKARNGYPTTPAMAAGVADHVWTLTEIAALLD